MSNLVRRRASTILFSLIIGGLLGLGGFILGDLCWEHFGPPATDADDMQAYLCGVSVGAVLALGGGSLLLWWFWPRSARARLTR